MKQIAWGITPIEKMFNPIPMSYEERVRLQNIYDRKMEMIDALIAFFDSKPNKFEVIYKYVNGFDAPKSKAEKKSHSLQGCISMHKLQVVYEECPWIIAQYATYMHYFGRSFDYGFEKFIVTKDNLDKLKEIINNIFKIA